jgi:hypothetical protein
MTRRNPLFNSNRLKLGIFGTNGKGGAQTLVPEAYTPTWASSLLTARLADEAGLEAIVAYARWKPYDGGGDNSPFTNAFLRHLVGAPGLELNELFQRVTKDVWEETKNERDPQVPWAWSSLIEKVVLNSGLSAQGAGNVRGR